MNLKERIYPFSAIVGQEDMKRALILNAINPLLGGVLIRGEKGTAKSTAVRSLAEILPPYEACDCVFRCNPYDTGQCCGKCAAMIEKGNVKTVYEKMKVVNLPVSATEDRVVGTLDIEHAIKTGEKKFEPGILAQANRNILYVDEVNLLDDHIVDLLLDSAAMGINTVEREGISFTHPARFVLAGTMNPEEGDLRPQLLDRFGLVVQVEGEHDENKRVEVIKRRMEFEQNPEGFIKKYEKEQEELKTRIIDAQKRLFSVIYDDNILKKAARIGIKMDVDGHRADITLIKTAVANAAFECRGGISGEDMQMAAKFVLPHRLRRRPFEEGKVDFEKIEKIMME